MRADQLLLQLGLASSRSQAQRLIGSGVLWRVADAPWQRIHKNGQELPAQAELQVCDASETAFVSRGGLKLQGALAATGWTVAQRICLDVGQSTGGFTDCLLQHGAAHVLGLDVGHGQLHPRLRQHPQVTALEGVNARLLSPALLQDAASGVLPAAVWQQVRAHGFDCIVGDLSFISLRLVLPSMLSVLAATGRMLLLVKPQFELQVADIGKGGIVRDPSKYAIVENAMRQLAQQHGLQVAAWLPSAIAGGDGNREFIIALHRGHS